MTFHEPSKVEAVCRAFTCWNGWGPPTSEYQIMEFCKSEASSEADADEKTEVLLGWMRGDYDFENPIILKRGGT